MRNLFWIDYMICGDVISENALKNLQKLIITKNYLYNAKQLNKNSENEIDIAFVGEIEINILEEFMQKWKESMKEY